MIAVAGSRMTLRGSYKSRRGILASSYDHKFGRPLVPAVPVTYKLLEKPMGSLLWSVVAAESFHVCENVTYVERTRVSLILAVVAEMSLLKVGSVLNIQAVVDRIDGQ